MKRVMIVLRNPLFAKAIEELLIEKGMEILGLETDPERIVEKTIQLQPDTIVFDCNDEQTDISTIMAQTLRKGLKTKFIGLSLNANELSVYKRQDRKVSQLEDFLNEIE